MSFPPQINEASDFSKINGQRLSMSLVPNFTVDEKKIVDDVVEEQEQQLLNIAIQRFSPEQIKEWQNNPIGWSEANKFIEAADIVPGGGLIKGYEALELSALAKKRANNEELSESEKTDL